MKKILLSIVLLIGILLSCGFQTTQELERKSGGYTESELVASGRVGVEGSDGTLFFSGFYKAPNGNYIPLNDNALMGQTIQPTSNPTKAENKKESAVSDSTNQQGLVEAEDKKDIQVVPLAEALETAGLVQMETEYATEILIYTIRERSNNSKDLEAVNSEEGKKRIETFLAGIDRMKNAENSELKGQEIAGISLYFSDDTNKDGVVGFSPAFLVKDQQTGELKPYAFSQNSLDDNNKILNIIDLSAGGDGYDLECMEIDGQPTFTRKIEGVTKQYLDNAGEWQKKLEERFAGLSECKTWREAKENCVITLDQLKSGVLVDYAREVTKPFPEDSYRIAFPNYIVSTVGTILSFYPYGDEMSQETIKYVYSGRFGLNNAIFSDSKSPVGDKLFFWVKETGTSELAFPALALVEKIRNKDGSDGYLTIVLPINPALGDPSLSEGATAKMFDAWTEKMAYQPPFYDAEVFKTGNWGNVLKEKANFLSRIAIDSGDKKKKLIDKWQIDGIISEELAKEPLLGAIFSSSEAGWAKK